MNGTFERKSEHNHLPSEDLHEKLSFRRDVLKVASRNATCSANEIIESELVARNNDTAFVPDKRREEQAIHRRWHKTEPRPPKTLECPIVLKRGIPPGYMVRDVKVETDGKVTARHIILATPMQLDLVKKCRTIYIDGTFSCVKKPYYQLFSIHSFLRCEENIKQVPLVNVIMSGKTRSDYNSVFAELKTHLGDAFNPDSCMVDYEVAIWQSLVESFPDIVIHGCHFHFSQAINRNVNQYGLSLEYKTEGAIRRIIKGIYSLPYLPPRDMLPAFNSIANNARQEETCEKLMKFLDYVESTWFRSSIWRPYNISVYNRLVRTNNDLEGYHNRLNSRCGSASKKKFNTKSDKSALPRGKSG